MKSSRLPAFLALAFAIACDASSSADVVAKAGSQQLTVTRLSEIIGNSQAPVGDKDVGHVITELWVNYQLAALSAAKNDSVTDKKVVDDGLWSNLESIRSRKFGEILTKTLEAAPSDCNDECAYNRGDILGARHILISAPDGTAPGSTAATPEQRAAAKSKADAIRSQVNPGNFAKLAERTEDPSGKTNGGDLGLFPKGQMVGDFEKAVLAIQPGEISPVTQTAYGYHVIYRSTYNDVKDQAAAMLKNTKMERALNDYFEKLEKASDVKISPNAALTAKKVARNPFGYKDDNGTVADFKGGKLTVSRLADRIAAADPRQQIRPQLQQAPDSVINKFVQSLVRMELLLKQADSAKVVIDSAEVTNLHMAFRTNLTGAWQQLGVEPSKLSDSAKTPADREKVAGQRVESYFDKLIRNEVPFVDVAYPVARSLQRKYSSSINETALEKSVETAKAVRASVDSARAKTGPPLPGGGNPPATPPATPPAGPPPVSPPPANK